MDVRRALLAVVTTAMLIAITSVEYTSGLYECNVETELQCLSTRDAFNTPCVDSVCDYHGYDYMWCWVYRYQSGWVLRWANDGPTKEVTWEYCCTGECVKGSMNDETKWCNMGSNYVKCVI
jgi:hypothetical protein